MVLVIGVSGPSTSGKSTIANELAKELKCQIICVDSYFKVYSELPLKVVNGIEFRNYDSNDAIEWNYLLEDVDKYKNDEFLIIEGFILFGVPEINKLVDILISLEFTDADMNEAMRRRFARMEQDIPLDYEEDPLKSNAHKTAYYFVHIVWPAIEENKNYLEPENWDKPIIRLSALSPISDNIQKSIQFVNAHIKRGCLLI